MVSSITPRARPPEVPIDPRDAAAVRRRERRRREERDVEGARVLADVLCALDAATPSERMRAESLSTPARGRLTRRGWTLVAHETLDRAVCAFFEAVAAAVLATKGRPDIDAGFSPRYRVDLATTTMPFARVFAHVSSVLDVPTPRLFVREDVAGGVTHMPVYPLASLAGGTLLSGFSAPELRFALGAHSTFYVHGLYALTLLPSITELVVVARAALHLAGTIRAQDAATLQVVRVLAPRLTPLSIEALRLAISQWRVHDAGSFDASLETALAAWRRAARLTADRAGLLVGGRVGDAFAMLEKMGPRFPGDSIDDDITELLRFAVSARYASLRRTLEA